VGEQIDWMDGSQASGRLPLAEWRPYGIDNQGFTHDHPPEWVRSLIVPPEWVR
jgi:hypothetical protein